MSFQQAHDFVAKWEGGYSNHPNDSGGPTNHGVSRAFLKAEGLWEADLNGDGEFSEEEIKALTKEDAARFFRKVFWTAKVADLDHSHPLMAFVAYDTGVNMGMRYAYRLVQQAVYTDDDGIWGPKTWRAIDKMDDLVGALSMIEIRKGRYAVLAEVKPKNKVFLRGWLNRCADLERTIRAIYYEKYSHTVL